MTPNERLKQIADLLEENRRITVTAMALIDPALPGTPQGLLELGMKTKGMQGPRPHFTIINEAQVIDEAQPGQ